MKVIYIDVLLVLNIYVDYLLLRTAAGLTHSPLSGKRCLAAAVFGSLFSLVILAPPLSPLLSAGLRLTAAVSMTAAAFGLRPVSRLALNTGVFFGVNLVFAGGVYAVGQLMAPEFLYLGNCVVYADISLIVLVLTTGGLYLIIRGAAFLIGSSPRQNGCYFVTIRKNGQEVRLRGFSDTGNILVDLFTGKPVIICGGEDFRRISGLSGNTEDLPKGCRLIPCSTISGTGVIPVFKPDSIVIEDTLTGKFRSVEALAGLGNTPEAVFNPRLLEL